MINEKIVIEDKTADYNEAYIENNGLIIKYK